MSVATVTIEETPARTGILRGRDRTGMEFDMSNATCSYADCGRKSHARGLCGAHYMQAKRGQALHPVEADTSASDRIMAKVQKTPSGCWEWRGTVLAAGYGQIKFRGQMWPVHRLMYVERHGQIASELVIDHLCRNRVCCNPDHLEAVTDRVNILRGEAPTAENARKTHCIHGHPFDTENTILRPEGGRRCRSCQRVKAREWARRKRLSIVRGV